MNNPTMNIKKLLTFSTSLALLFCVQVGIVQAATLPVGAVTTCGEIEVAGTYSLSNDIGSGGTCITVNADGATIEGNGHTINGNIISATGIGGAAGISITINNATVTGTTTSGDGSSSGGMGGAITVSSSTMAAIVSGNAGPSGSANAGRGGAITLTSSTFTTITSGNGNNATNKPGPGGNIEISGSVLNLSGKTVTAGSAVNGGLTGTLTLTYDTITADSLTSFFNVSDLIINGISHGAWNGGVTELPDLTHTITAASQCSLISSAGTFSLASNITGDCEVGLDGVIIDGAGFTLTGNISSINAANVALQNITINGSVTSSDGTGGGSLRIGGDISIATSTVTGSVTSGNGASGGFSLAYGGAINITNSTVGAVISGYGEDVASSVAGWGGAITIVNSTFDSITSGHGGNSGVYIDGWGGPISISGSTVDLSGKTITAGNPGLPTNGSYYVSSGTLTITYTSQNGLTTNSSTFFNNVSNLIINNASYGSWNGIFNPTGMVFNDQAPNHGTTGDWASAANWWLDEGATVPAGRVPNSSDNVRILNGVSTISAGTASVRTAIFASSTNAIAITASGGVTFTSAGSNTSGGVVNADAIFEGDEPTNAGSIGGSVTRLYKSNATTTLNFTNNGGRSNWIIVADGVQVDISGATYSTDANTFKAVNNGSFVGGTVVPDVQIISPASANIVKWSPSVTWGTSIVCEYSYDNFVTSTFIDCGANGTNIARPTAGAQTLYVRGRNYNGSLTERSYSFTYDNTGPIPTSCNGEVLDESTRPYYYLEGNVTGTCYFRANTELRGASTTAVSGFTITGNVSGDQSYTNGYNIILKNITVTGTVSANGGIGQISGVTGKNGGNITIASSTIGNIVSNGGNGPERGGNGGEITLVNTAPVAPSSTITANGGDATSCGYGGNGGHVFLYDSGFTQNQATTNEGNDQTAIGVGLCSNPPYGGSRTAGSVQSSGQYVGPSQPSNTTTGSDSESSGGAPVVSRAEAPSTHKATPLVTSTTEPQPQEVTTTETTPTAAENLLTKVGVTRESARRAVAATRAVVSSPTSQAVEATGIAAGFLTATAFYIGGMFSTPLLASEFLLIPVRLWGLLMMAFGLKKRIAPWGTVYDSVTKRPIDPAYVTVTDESGKVVAEAITDVDGRYGFLLPDGKYKISAMKTHYEFPSKKLYGMEADEMYKQLYFGDEVVVRTGQVIDKNIPLDPIGFDWNEYVKNEKGAELFHKEHERTWRVIGDILFKAGLALSVVSLIVHTSTYNAIMLSTYVLVYVFWHFGFKGKQLGSILDSKTHKPLGFAIFRVLSLDRQTTFRSGVCDEFGKYYCIVPKGKYYLDIEKKNEDGTYSKVFESEVISGDKGIINKSFFV